MPENEIHKAEFQKETSDVLARTISGIAEGVTGIAASQREDLILSVGHIFQRMRAGQFLGTLKREWDKYKGKGRIKPDYESTEQHKSSLQELLSFLDKDAPDELRFSLLKKIFLIAATETASNRDSHLPLQYMQIARTLTSGEILVLNAEYTVATKNRQLWGGQAPPYNGVAKDHCRSVRPYDSGTSRDPRKGTCRKEYTFSQSRIRSQRSESHGTFTAD